MKSQLKPIEIGYEDRKFVFHLRMVSVAEESDYDQRFADIAESDPNKYDREFQLCKQALGEFSIGAPEKVITEKGKPKRVPIDSKAESSLAAIEKAFAERTPENERLIRRAYSIFKSQLDPDIRFL